MPYLTLYLEGRNEATLTTSAVSTALSIVSNLNEEAIKEFETGNGIYKISKKLMGLQSIYEHKVICTWYDKVLAFIGQNNIGNEEINYILDLVEFDGTEEYRKNSTRTFSLVGAKKRMNCGMMARGRSFSIKAFTPSRHTLRDVIFCAE